MYATRFWLMHILDMETFYDHKSSQFIQAEDSLLDCSIEDCKTQTGRNPYIFSKITRKGHILEKRNIFFMIWKYQLQFMFVIKCNNSVKLVHNPK